MEGIIEDKLQTMRLGVGSSPKNQVPACDNGPVGRLSVATTNELHIPRYGRKIFESHPGSTFENRIE